MGTQVSKVKLGMCAFTVALAISLVGGVFGTTQTASAAVRTTCSSGAPSFKSWQKTVTYGLANAFCIKDSHNAWLVWQSDGNLVWYVHGTPRWYTNTHNRGKTFKLQSDGNMVIYDASNKAIWASSWMKYNGYYWWSPGMTATGDCSFNVGVRYYSGVHYFNQGLGCNQKGAQFWEGGFRDAID